MFTAGHSEQKGAELEPEPEPELGSDRGFVCRCGRLVPDERDRQDQGAHGRGRDHSQVNSSFFLFLSISLSLFHFSLRINQQICFFGIYHIFIYEKIMKENSSVLLILMNP